MYHNLDPAAPSLVNDASTVADYRPSFALLELVALVSDVDDPAEAFDRVIHRDGENWTDAPGVRFFGDRRGRRSSQEGDVFVSGDGTAHLVLPIGFRVLAGLRLPFLP